MGKKVKKNENTGRLKWGFVIGAFLVVLAASAMNSPHSHKISTFLNNHKICSCSQVLSPSISCFFECFISNN